MAGRALGPLRRCTPPGTRETTLRRPVSWLATGRGPWDPPRRSAFSRVWRNGVWTGLVAYSCGGSRGLAVRGTTSRVPVSALSGHRRMGGN